MKNPNEVKTKSIFHFVPTRSARAPPPVTCRARRTPAERARAPSGLTEPKRETRRRGKPGASLHRGRGQSRSAGWRVGSQTALVTRGLQAEAVAAPDQLLGLPAAPVERASLGGAWAGGSEKATTCWELCPGSPALPGDGKRRRSHPPGRRRAGEVGHADALEGPSESPSWHLVSTLGRGSCDPMPGELTCESTRRPRGSGRPSPRPGVPRPLQTASLF